MRTFSAAATAAALAATLCCARAAPAPVPLPNHPILGIWVLTMPDGSCSEVYRFRGDGTALVTSAEEISESEFSIPAKPSKNGYYKLQDKVVKGNGKKDCAGETTKIGSTATNFVRIHPSGSLFLMCATESMDTCIGPFRRLVGKGT